MSVERVPILAVLGAINVDLVASGAPLPGPGQTVTGATFGQHHGGKGGNQAVAAARVFQRGAMLSLPKDVRPGVWMLGAVGDDQLGVSALEALRADDVQTDHVLVTRDAPTGTALIVVDPGGENQIVVAPGANAQLDPRHVVDALETLRPNVLLVSLEVPETTARAAVAWAPEHETTVILNPAPFQPWVRDLLSLATYVTPNEGEFASLGDVRTSVTVIETRGVGGARIHKDGSVDDVPTIDVDVVDTTGAGDCFNGVLAAELAHEVPINDAVRRAVVAAALSVRVAGAREGMPTLNDLSEALNP